MSSKQQQADSKLHEDQLLNFLVNRLDEVVQKLRPALSMHRIGFDVWTPIVFPATSFD